MMGNEGSQLSGLEIEEKAAEITDFWAHYRATINDSCSYFSLKSDGSVSVFKGEVVSGPLWTMSTPLEKFSNNLLKYRHPCILRYVSAWQQRSTFYLATEYVQPLAQVLGSLTPLQICIGLNNILRALVFLHQQAGMSHNNVSMQAIYVTGDGQWKLGGLQYLCSFQELTAAYLKHARIHRYDKAVDPNEDSQEVTKNVDQYGFAALVDDVFAGHEDDQVPHLKEFKQYCRNSLQHSNPEMRPSLKEVLQHSFYNHEFISIYKFLNFLPLKSEEERSEFFSTILETLKCYHEETVAKQLGGLLLSRLTMLDQTARKDVIPFILKPKHERSQNCEYPGFFSISVFKEHVKPRLMQLFGVRDSQIRMLLLTHFSKYVHVFSHEELSQHILPELLLGIKDTDDNLVASTLICLSELVPILGASTVIGGKRSKYFTDGRPNSKSSPHVPPLGRTPDNTFAQRKSLKDLSCSEETFKHNDEKAEVYDAENISHLIERPSPVGGESVEIETVRINSNVAEASEDDWSDWDNTNNAKNASFNHPDIKEFEDIPLAVSSEVTNQKPLVKSSLLQKAAIQAKKNIIDISELDIKNQKFENIKKAADEFDFFADMTPVIEKPTMSAVAAAADSLLSSSSKLAFVPDDGADGSEGWGENWND
ncbi:protein-associating with the carboxyl-terminal domain of ezrin [Cydia pomonella]|uniref:protein-associating with the carboxyl-terminal domain of ezrin n=1 Tax=Cydia pomonella TaxID=82600 RepID=UPI002ADE60B4|nr:protein-associating with the carboxyl-terminal domain of ezrin [Cydia pomonella]